MSTFKAQGNASGTGEVTLQTPNTNTNRTISLPDATTTLVGTDATQTLTNKTLTSPTLTTPTVATIKSAASATPTVFQDSAGTEIGTLCRAWVNFQGGNGNSAGTRNGNFNVSSVTANGTGDYTINFTTAMPDTNFSVVGATKLADSSATTNNTIIIGPWSYATGSVRIYTTRPGDSLNNCTTVNIAIFR